MELDQETRRLLDVTGFRGSRTHDPAPAGTVSDTSRNVGRE